MTQARSAILSLALVMLAAASARVDAADLSDWWITPGAVSYHVANRDHLNQIHPGLGVEYHFKPDWTLVGGTYKNSNYRWSEYFGANWTPLALGPAKIGLTAQVANHYNAAREGGPFLFAAPVISFEGSRFGANIYVIPTLRNVTGAVALQLKFRL